MFESGNGDFDIQKTHINGKGDYVITAGLTNNGILGKTDVSAKVFDARTITVDMFGFAFYRNFAYKMVTHARVFSLKLKSIITVSDRQGLFLASAFHFLNKKFGYENMCSWEKIKQDKIQLPTKDGAIDFDFMETFICELEEERINNLIAYLTANGFDNCELSDAERKALADFDCVKWQEYKIGDLFEIENTASLNSDKLVQGCEYDYVTRTSLNQGILTSTGFINKENINPAGTWSLGLLQMDFFYRKKPWYAGQFVRRIVPKIEMQAGAVLFFSVLLNRQKTRLLSVLVRNVNNVFRSTKIQLPTKDGKIDFDFMEMFISAIKKFVIKNVVLYADRKIKTTSQLLQK